MIAVLITCFNRKNMTLDIVAKFAHHSEIFDLYVVDGGSTDGTRDLLKTLCKKFHNVSLILQDDSYWAESMRLAWETAIRDEKYDGYLLLNDDLQIESKRIVEFLDELNSFQDSEIRVGQCQDDSKLNVTYGALARKSNKSRIHFRIAKSEDRSVTFNANFVYVPNGVVSKIGIFSNRFRHSFADIDYGLRAARRNIPIRLIPSPVGTTNYNTAWSESLTNLSLRNWKQILLDPKGIPVKEWLYFCYTHGGILWLVNFFMRYWKLFHMSFKNKKNINIENEKI